MPRGAIPKPVEEGSRIRLTSMPQDPCPVPSGTEGTVNRTQELWDGAWQIGVNWDNGRTLSLIVPPDSFETLSVPKKPD